MDLNAAHELSARADATLDALLGVDAALYERAAALLPHEEASQLSMEALLADAAALAPSSPSTAQMTLTSSSFVDSTLLEELLQFDGDAALDGTIGSHKMHAIGASSEPFEAEPPGTSADDDMSAAVSTSSSDSDERSPARTTRVTQPATETEKTNTSKPQYNTTRKRQAEELKYLRIKVMELEKELGTLQESDKFAVGSNLGSLQSTLSSGTVRAADGGWCQAGAQPLLEVPGLELAASHQRALDPPVPSKLWKRVAKNQQQGRQRAELENVRLRETLVSQLKIVKGLEKVLKKRANTPEDLIYNMRKRVRFGDESEASIFAKLAGELDARYLTTDLVFQENGFAASKVEMQNSKVKVDAVHGLYMEFLDSKLLPFEVHKTQDALWRSLRRASIPLTDGHYANVDHTHDIISAKMAFRFQHNRRHAVADAKFVAKRFVEEDRVVFVWTTCSDATGSFCGPNGIQLMNYGWTIIERVASGDAHDGAEEQLSLIQSCARIIPQLPNTPDEQEQQVGLLVDLVTGSFLRNMSSFHQAAEDLLVEEALRGGS